MSDSCILKLMSNSDFSLCYRLMTVGIGCENKEIFTWDCLGRGEGAISSCTILGLNVIILCGVDRSCFFEKGN